MAAHIAVDQTAAVQNKAGLHCTSASAHVNAHIRFIVNAFTMTGLFAADPKLGIQHHGCSIQSVKQTLGVQSAVAKAWDQIQLSITM